METWLAYLRNSWNFHHFQAAKKINGFFYFLRKIPGLNTVIKETIYQFYAGKEIFTVLAMLFSILFSVVKKGLYLAGSFFIACVMTGFAQQTNGIDLFLQGNSEVLTSSLLLWWLLTGGCLAFVTHYRTTYDKGQLDYISNFLLSRTEVIRGETVLEVLSNSLAYLPAAWVYGLLMAQQPLLVMAFVFISYNLGNVAAMYLVRRMYRWPLTAQRGIAALYTLCMLGLAACSWFVQPFLTVSSWLLQPVALLILLVLLCGITFLFLRFRDENDFILGNVEESFASIEKAAAATSSTNKYLSEGLSMQKKLTMSEDTSVNHLSGSSYLNALLFSRYNEVLFKALRLRLLFFLGIALLIVAGRVFGITKAVTASNVAIVLPFLMMVMYVCSFGKKIVQMLFVNCDIAMLYYPFYREASTILGGFRYRFKRTFQYNVTMVVALLLLFVLFHVLNGFLLDWQFFAVLILLLTSLAFLFSFHELFIYYILQPFTSDMEVQNPIYKLVSGVLYGISYMSTQSNFPGILYALIISACSLLYVGVGFVVIYKKAPQTFKIRA